MKEFALGSFEVGKTDIASDNKVAEYTLVSSCSFGGKTLVIELEFVLAGEVEGSFKELFSLGLTQLFREQSKEGVFREGNFVL